MEAIVLQTGTLPMARKVIKPQVAPPAKSDDRQIVISMKGSAEFRDWLHRLADDQRVSAVNVIELALVEFARNRGFKEAAPKRTK
jgi:hypothetical protein